MACNAPLKRLYQRYIVEKRPVPRQGRRNSDLIDLVTFLHGATGRAPALELARAFWELNQDIFTDPLDQHMREAEAHLNAREQTWLATLSQDEQALAGQLIQSHREAFRICRDLASLDTHESPRGHFFLSMTDLSERISMRTVEAQRILSVFEALGCLEIATKGTRHAKGVRGIATRYRWLLPLPQ